MRARSLAYFFSAALAVATLAAGCSEDMALVGGACAAGLSECQLRCVDVSTDPANCGSCGNACGAGIACIAGTCGGNAAGLDATIEGSSNEDAASDAGADATVDGTTSGDASDASDAADSDATVADSSANDASEAGTNDAPTGDGSQDAAGEACAPPFDTVDHCGDCTTRCTAPNDACKPVDGGFACGTLCQAPLSNCGGTCVDQDDDPANCGACGKFCASHLCSGGACQGTTPGDVVVIGHDFATTPLNTAQGRVLANAVFISSTNPLRVMSYERYSDTAAVTRAKAILAQRATQMGRTIAYTVTVVDNDVRDNLAAATYDVLLVHDQLSAPAGVLATLGTDWKNTSTAFTQAGGVVVVLDGNAGTGEMPALVASATLLDVTSHATLGAGSAVSVTAPSDVVAVGVLSPYGVWDHSARFTVGASPNVTLVVRSAGGAGDPVVVHRTVP